MVEDWLMRQISPPPLVVKAERRSEELTDRERLEQMLFWIIKNDLLKDSGHERRTKRLMKLVSLYLDTLKREAECVSLNTDNISTQ